MGRRQYVLLAVSPQQVNSQRRRLLPILFGVLIGYLLGISFTFESESDAENVIRSVYGKLPNVSRNSKELWLRCVVTIDPQIEKVEKFIEAVRDTYARRCNQTLYFTSSTSLQTRFSNLEFYRIDTDLSPSRWSLFYRILEFVRKTTKAPDGVAEFTVLANERTFVIFENLKHFLSLLPEDAPIAAGKVISLRSYLHYLFPFTDTHMFSLDAGVVLSKSAIDRIISHPGCRPSYLFKPWYAGRALLQCFQEVEIPVWDPVDAEGYRMFLSDSPRSLFAGSNKFTLLDSVSENTDKTLSTCCSDKAITFGLVNYRDQRVMEYFLDHVRVFGVQSISP